MPRGARLTVSRADVAHFLLEELEHRAHVHRIVGMASVKGKPGNRGDAVGGAG